MKGKLVAPKQTETKRGYVQEFLRTWIMNEAKKATRKAFCSLL